MKDQLISAKELRNKQKEYLDNLVDKQMETIIKVLNDAYTKESRIINFNGLISSWNKKKLEDAGYSVDNFNNGSDNCFRVS